MCRLAAGLPMAADPTPLRPPATTGDARRGIAIRRAVRAQVADAITRAHHSHADISAQVDEISSIVGEDRAVIETVGGFFTDAAGSAWPRRPQDSPPVEQYAEDPKEKTMPLMEWNASLSTGITVFDNDHKKLVALINELYDAVSAGKGQDAMGKILDALIDYTRRTARAKSSA
jgi:hypothetical protein